MRQVNGISSCDLIRMILESLVAPFLLYKAGLKKKPLTEIMLVPVINQHSTFACLLR